MFLNFKKYNPIIYSLIKTRKSKWSQTHFNRFNRNREQNYQSNQDFITSFSQDLKEDCRQASGYSPVTAKDTNQAAKVLSFSQSYSVTFIEVESLSDTVISKKTVVAMRRSHPSSSPPTHPHTHTKHSLSALLSLSTILSVFIQQKLRKIYIYIYMSDF